MARNDNVVDIREKAIATGLDEESKYAEMLLSSYENIGLNPRRVAEVVCALLASRPLRCSHIECKITQLEFIRFVLHGSPYKTSRNAN